jgi:hypothetical protein
MLVFAIARPAVCFTVSASMTLFFLTLCCIAQRFGWAVTRIPTPFSITLEYNKNKASDTTRTVTRFPTLTLSHYDKA